MHKQFDPDGDYCGALYFEPNSIKVFDPIGQDIVARVWPEVKRFGRVMWILDDGKLGMLERKMTGVKKA